MIDWKKRRTSRARLNLLFELVDASVHDEKVRRRMKNKIVDILYLPMAAVKEKPPAADAESEFDAGADADTEFDAGANAEPRANAKPGGADSDADADALRARAIVGEFSGFSICG